MENFSSSDVQYLGKVNGLTGCLTILDSEINQLNFEASNFNCEDTLNFIRSHGSINSIFINNSISDALDSDFSKLDIKNINVDRAGNDCSDFSFGNYKIILAEMKNCGDKATSVGEKSKMEIENIVISNSFTGIASKDSSETSVINSKINDVKVCYASYKKKQEFSGGNIYIDNSECSNYNYLTKVDNFSSVKIKN